MNWWKALCILLTLYTLYAGLLLDVPHLPILNESIRNLYFHVPMWFGMIILLGAAAWYSIRYLATQNPLNDIRAKEFTSMGMLLGVLGLTTGMIWAKFTWGDYWSGDPKQNASAIGMLLYLAYTVLRGSFVDEMQRARISAVYNIFCYAALIPLLFILPRLTDSLHPGNGGNPGFNAYDLDNRMRMVFYPAIAAWTLIGCWLANIRIRISRLQQHED